MKNSTSHFLRLALAICCLGISTYTSARINTNDDPIITLKTNIYQQAGSSNQFSIVLGVSDSMYVDIDCGAGPEEYQLIPGDTTGNYGTLIYCSVDAKGVVKIYGDNASLITYLNADGCYLSAIDLTQLDSLDILSISHNELQSLDLTQNTALRALYVSDNPFTEATPLVVGNKPDLQILEVAMIDYLDPNFDLTQYPKMLSFDAYHTPTLTKINPTACPNLLQLSLEMTNIKTIDVSKNDSLVILNISETGVSSLDISHNKRLQQLYCEHVSGWYNQNVKINELDVTNNPDLVRLVCRGNNIKTLDVSKCPYLISLHASDNQLSRLDVSKNTNLNSVLIKDNNMDFATLPLDSGVWEEYEYSQRPMPVAKSYPEGAVIDFSSRVLRAGTTTEFGLYAVDITNPDYPTLLDTSYYTYEDGVVTLRKAHSDSLMCAFANPIGFPAANLYSTRFKVKIASEYGKPTEVCSFTAQPQADSLRFAVGLFGASEEHPITFYVQFGNSGVLTPMIATSQTTPAVANVKEASGYTTVKIYVPDSTNISALSIRDCILHTIDLSQLDGLQELSLVNTGLYAINLSMNHHLKTLDLSGNNLTIADLSGVNDLFNKNVLHTINLSNNRIQNLTLNPLLAIHHINLSNNQIEEIDLADADNIETIDLSNNKISRLSLTYCSALDSLVASYNQLNELRLPDENNINYLAIDNNLFTFANLPLHGNISEENYRYAPQADIQIATKAPCADLADQLISVGDSTTKFAWIKEDGTALIEGTDYTNTDGYMRFLNTDVDSVYCRITHSAFPDFAGENALKTTKMFVAGMPTNKIASFVTTNDNDTVTLSLAAKKAGTSVYFTWKGEDNIQQYVLETSYKQFRAITHKNTKVDVYTYEPTDTVHIFSITGAKMSSFDGTNLLVSALTVSGAGLSSITLPNQKDAIYELNLSGNHFTSFNAAQFPNLYMLTLNGNLLQTIDLSKNANLGTAMVADNQLKSVQLSNPNLWALDLSGNQLTTIDLTAVPEMYQLFLSNNLLSTIDISAMPLLNVLNIDGNKFDFTTLPTTIKEDGSLRFSVYHYQNQQMLDINVQDGVVDISSQAAVGDSLTTYTWYLDFPIYNSELGMFEGEELIEGYEYTIDNGVTTFLTSFNGVICLMTNPMFPNLYLYTNLLDIVLGWENIAAGLRIGVIGRDILIYTEAGLRAELYNLSGMLIGSTLTAPQLTTLHTPAAGGYILHINGQAYKLIVP